MKAMLFLIATLLLIPRLVFAQETPETPEWTTEQRCVTTFAEPPEGWTYDGVIFTFRQGDGVHARRADVPTRYYVAFDGESEFGSLGSFSPDGRWFAVPAGHVYFTSMTWRKIMETEEYRIYSTLPNRALYRIVIEQREAQPARWLDNNLLLIDGFSGDIFQSESYVFNITDGSLTKMATRADAALVNRDNLSSDGTILAFGAMDAYNTIHIQNFETHVITDTCIESPYSIAFSPNGGQVAFGLEPAGFVYILDLEAWEAYRLDLAANNVIGWYPIS
jgi:WD40 repeat protein